MQKYLLNKSTWDEKANRHSPYARKGPGRKSPERGEVTRDPSASLDSVGSGFFDDDDEDEMMSSSFDTMEMSPVGNRCVEFPNMDNISDIDEDPDDNPESNLYPESDMNIDAEIDAEIDEIGRFVQT